MKKTDTHYLDRKALAEALAQSPPAKEGIAFAAFVDSVRNEFRDLWQADQVRRAAEKAAEAAAEGTPETTPATSDPR